MPYTIRTCKECGQKLHIRQKGNQLNIKNRCVHFDNLTMSRTQLDEQTIPIGQFRDKGSVHDIPDLCIVHNTHMIFKEYQTRYAELHHCKLCAVLDKLIPMSHIRSWQKRSHTAKWSHGDVRVIISPDYNTIMKQKVKK